LNHLICLIHKYSFTDTSQQTPFSEHAVSCHLSAVSVMLQILSPLIYIQSRGLFECLQAHVAYYVPSLSFGLVISHGCKSLHEKAHFSPLQPNLSSVFSEGKHVANRFSGRSWASAAHLPALRCCHPVILHNCRPLERDAHAPLF
jgi:hypothetical protein